MDKIVVNGIICGLLLVSAVQDGIHKKISLWIVVLGGLALCICIPFCRYLSLGSRFGGLILGLGIILLGKITGGKIGLGDGLILSVMGLGLGLWMTLEVFALALFFAAILSVILLVFKGANMKKEIAFIPFLFIAYLIILLI